jgi:hypothetical protein
MESKHENDAPPPQADAPAEEENQVSLPEEPAQEEEVIEEEISPLEPSQEEDTGEETEPPPPEPPDRLKRWFRRALYGALALTVVFLLGLLTGRLVLYNPAARRLDQANQELQDANQRVRELESRLSDLLREKETDHARQEELQESYQLLQEEMDSVRLHAVLLRIQADVNAARIALLDDDPSSARLYLSSTPDRLQELETVLGLEHRSVVENMEQRLGLVLDEMRQERELAQADLEVLANHLMQLENTLFAVP